MKIVVIIASVVVFGVLCAAMGIPATYLVISMSNDPAAGFGFFAIGISFMSVFGILGAALGGYVGYRITRSKSFK